MNLSNLEKLTRLAVKGGKVDKESEKMLKAGLLTAAEHRSVSSLSWQIAANVRAGADGGATLAYDGKPMGMWL